MKTIVALPLSATRPPRWPRLRLLLALLGSVAIAGLHTPWALGTALLLGGLALAGALVCGAAPGALLRRVLAVNLFVALLWLTLPWQLTTAPAGDWHLALSPEGVHLAQSISLRSNAVALWCLGWLAGLDAFAIARAAAGLGLPHKLARLLGLTVRYFSLLDDCRRRIERAMRARGFRPGFNLRTVQVTAQLVALLLVHAMLRAERVGVAMRARGFGAPAPISACRSPQAGSGSVPTGAATAPTATPPTPHPATRANPNPVLRPAEVLAHGTASGKPGWRG